MSQTKFKHYPIRPKRLTAAFAKKEYQKLLEQVAGAESSSDSTMWLKLFSDWNELSSYIGSEASRANYAYSKNLAYKKLEEREEYFREKIYPAIQKFEHELAKAFLASKYRSAIAKKYGQQLIPLYESIIKPMDPINISLQVKASRLVNSYEKQFGTASVKVRQQRMNISKARSLLFSEDRELREDAYQAINNWVLENHAEFAGIYDQLVKLRTKKAQNLDFSTYTPLAYLGMARTDYDPEKISQFRELVLKYFVPLFAKMAARQAKDLGLEKLRPWDIFYDPKLSVPLGVVPVGTQLDKAYQVFKKLSPKLGGHFDFMRHHNLIDLESRPNKHNNPFCTDFSDEAKVAILCNSTGDSDDVRTLMHEMGHAFQYMESQSIEVVDLQSGTPDLAEILSMGMEFLSLPYMTEFFSRADAQKFALRKWFDAIYTICYTCVVDEFQHWIYENPTRSPTQRDGKWEKIFSKYLGVIDFTGLEKYNKTRWYLQMHIFNSPFYYIDYALSETIAMQLALLDQKDHKKAMDIYLKLCRLGGTKSFLSAIKTAGLESPFDKTLIKRLMDHAEKVLL